MNKHEEISKLLVDFALGELSPQAQADLRMHLDECPQCRRELRRLEALLECTGGMRELSADPQACESAERAVLEAVKNSEVKQQTSGRSISLEFIRRITMNNRRAKLAAAAAVVMVVLGGVTFWPSGTPGNGQWWLGSPAVWGKEIIAEMEKIEALVHREQFVFVGRHGDTHVSGNWSRIYEAVDRVRTDKYYESTDESTFGDNSPDSVLVEVTWKVPDGKGLKSYHVSHELKCYTIKTIEGGAYKRDPMEKLRVYVGLLDKADRILETKTFDGRECVGFEVDTSEFADNSMGRTDRIWFDVKTKLPVRIEKHGIGANYKPARTFTLIDDQFEYHAQIPANKFEPKIPDGFINAEPHKVRADREKQEKSRLIYADVPAGVAAATATALRNVKAAIYYDGGTKISLSGHDWRKDRYAGDSLRETEWFVVAKDQWGRPRFDFNDEEFELTQTKVNYRDKFCRIVTHGSKSHPNNPMDRIMFLVGWINKADRFWENEKIGGIECFGFELSASKYGSNPDTNKPRIWFDAKTKLPVRTETVWVSRGSATTRVRDRFQWNPELAAETFKPEIPEDFTVKEQN